MNKIIPSLWFSKTREGLAEILNYYKSVFETNFESGEVMDLGDTPSGKTEISKIKIFGQEYSFMNTEKEHEKFNDSLSLTINCADQQEIDKYWNYFTKDGEGVQCGWCIDKYGIRWQIIPENLDELMSRPNSWEVMMKQKKIIIEEYLK